PRARTIDTSARGAFVVLRRGAFWQAWCLPRYFAS
ncbi:MAG: hypothetical protein ACI85K_002418, partial [Hyphomicrobiaceae bacterium]